MPDTPETPEPETPKADVVVNLGAHKARKALQATSEYVQDAIRSRDAYAAEEERLEGELGRFFRMEEDYEVHSEIPYLFIHLTLPRQAGTAERNDWLAKGALQVSSTGHLAREHQGSGSTRLLPDHSNQFWTTTIHLPVTGDEAMDLMRHPEAAAQRLGKLRTDETCIENTFDMAGMRRFQIERHPAYDEIFGSQGMSFGIWVSNRHPDPEDRFRSINPWRYGVCRHADDVAEAVKLIGSLERRSAMAKAPNVVDLLGQTPDEARTTQSLLTRFRAKRAEVDRDDPDPPSPA